MTLRPTDTDFAHREAARRNARKLAWLLGAIVVVFYVGAIAWNLIRSGGAA